MKKTDWNRVISVLLLLITALIWGIAFVAQSVGTDYVGPFTFLASRSLIAGIALLPLVLARRAHRKKESDMTGLSAKNPKNSRMLWIGGIVCGGALMVASSLQQIGIADTSVGKAGFITAMYIVIVPVLGIFLRKSISFFVWIGVGLATVGMYLLCMTESFSLARGDFFLLLCAVCFSIHILAVEHFSTRVDGVEMSCVQFFTCGILAAIAMLIWEQPSFQTILGAWLPILYAGLLSSGVGYTLQIIAQKNVPSTLASLLMSLESVFSVLAGWLILKETLSVRELIGCALVFVAVILAQLPSGKHA